MDTNRCHRASGYALEGCRMAIAVPDELQESVRPGSNRALRVLCGRSVAGQWQVCDLPANHRASQCALEGCRMAIAVPDELQESVGQGTNRAVRAVRAVCGRSVAVRRSSCKTSRERMCPGVLSRGVRGARWTQIDAIARADMPWRSLEGRLPCQMNCRNLRVWALTGL